MRLHSRNNCELTPRAGAERLAIFRDAEARNAIVVADELVNKLTELSVPNVAVVVVVAGEQHLARARERHGRDTAQNLRWHAGATTNKSGTARNERSAGRTLSLAYLLTCM